MVLIVNGSRANSASASLPDKWQTPEGYETGPPLVSFLSGLTALLRTPTLMCSEL
jgi:hypothetical protein